MMKEFAFLKATRFWALVIGAVSAYLKIKGYIGEAELTLIGIITGGFITVRTVDRATEQKILAEGVAAGQVNVSTLLEVPPSKVDNLGGGPIEEKKK